MEKILDAFIKEIFAKNPNITKEDMKNRLRAEKDLYRQNKERWRNSTICHRVDFFYKDKESKLQFASEIDLGPPKIEGIEIKRHPDIFRPEESIIDTSSNAVPETEFASPTELPVISNDLNAFKKELISIVKDLKKELNRTISSIEKEVSILKQELPKIRQELKIPEPEVEYDFLEIKKPLIAEIKKKCEEKGIDDESDYVDELIEFNEKWGLFDLNITKTIVDRYNALVDIIKEAGGAAHLKIDYDDKTGQLGVEETSMRFGFRTKMLIVIGVVAALFAGIGTGIGIASYFKLVALLPLPF